MNEEEQLGGTLPELTEEERQQLLADQERSQSQLDELGQAIAVDEEPEAESGSTGYTNKKTPSRTSNNPPRKRSGDTTKNYGDDIDDAFADLEGDPSFDSF